MITRAAYAHWNELDQLSIGAGLDAAELAHLCKLANQAQTEITELLGWEYTHAINAVEPDPADPDGGYMTSHYVADIAY